MQDLDINNNFNNKLNNNLVTGEEQKNFLQSKLGQVINFGFNVGLRYLLPDFIEEQIIDIKDKFLENGFKEGVKTAVDSAIDLGKSAIGIVTGKFDNISQVQAAIKTGGIIDSVSDVINNVVNKTVSSGKIPYNVGNMIKQGKNVILNSISKNIENEFESQLDSLEKISKYSENWKEYFLNKDFEGMEKEYKKINDKMQDLVPMENTIKKVRTIQNLHNLIKNNGQDFNLSEEEIELSNVL